MSDDTTQTESDKVDESPEGGSTGSGDNDAKGKASDGLEKDLAKERKLRQKLEADLKAEKEKSLTEAERVVAERDELRTNNKNLSTENTKLKLALQMGLPWSIGKRITGDTEEEMKADAEELLKDFKLSQDREAKDKADASSNGRQKESGRKPNDGKAGGSSEGKTDMNKLLRAAVHGGR